jgi:PPM family protein phosphatase
MVTDSRLTLDSFGLTDPGRRRARNEDQFLVATMQRSMLVDHTSLPQKDDELVFLGNPDAHIFVVADGMGGKDAGEVASSIAVTSIAQYVCNIAPFIERRLQRDTVRGLREGLVSAFEASDSSVRDAAAERKQSMGTTLTLAYLMWPRLYVAHAGDSRCYLRRVNRKERVFEQLTTDHTVAQRLADKGIDVDEASEMHHVLVNALGGSSAKDDPDVYRVDLRFGDTVLLCTDGLTKHVDAETIAEVLDSHDGAEAACRKLVDLANQGGGSDNITAVVVRARLESRTDRQKKQRRPSLVTGKLS